MLVPALLFAAGMIVWPFLEAAWLALHAFRFGEDQTFNAGWNYVRLARDAEFWHAMKLTFALYVVSLVAQLIVGTWLGLVLARVQFARELVRIVLVTPFMLPPVVIGMVAVVVLDPGIGVANWLLGKIGIAPKLFLADPETVILTLAAIDTWQWAPFVALIVLGGRLSLPADVFEAAEIDGATAWQTFRLVTLPLLGPTLISAAVLRSVDLLRFFDVIYITTAGGPGDASTTLNILAYRHGFQFFDIGYASAMMLTLAALVLGTVVIFTRLRAAVTW